MLPQNVLVESLSTVQNEKRIPAILRKKILLKSGTIAGIFQNIVSIDFSQTSKATYYGSYIDPPKLA
jgi:hypothetical protein